MSLQTESAAAHVHAEMPNDIVIRNYTYHPRFNSPEADIVLTSSEDTAYRVHSFTLRNTCGYFRSILPQNLAGASSSSTFGAGAAGDRRGAEINSGLPFDSHTGTIGPIEMPEKDMPLCHILSLLSGLPYTPLTSIDDVDEALCLAKRLDAPGPVSIIRSSLITPVFLSEQPLRLYAIATKFGWVEEAQIASTETLALDLYYEGYKEDLERISPRALMRLLRLHRKRREDLKTFLDSTEQFELGNQTKCLCPGCETEMDNHTWRELKWRMLLEMDKRSLGDSLYSLDMEEWPEAIACWSATCSKSDCARVYYDKIHTLKKVKCCIDDLPVCV